MTSTIATGGIIRAEGIIYSGESGCDVVWMTPPPGWTGSLIGTVPQGSLIKVGTAGFPQIIQIKTGGAA